MSDLSKTPSSTPRRRLGMRFSMKRNSPLTPQLLTSQDLNQTPTGWMQEKLHIVSPSTPVEETPQSKSVPSSLMKATPVTAKSSTNRISLSINKSNKQPISCSKNRDKLTKKRLNFIGKNSTQTLNKENCISVEKLPTNTWTETSTKTDTTIDELRLEIEQKRTELSAIEKYKQEKAQLEHLINIWQAGTRNVLDALKQKIKPPMDELAILAHLKIPPTLLNN